MAANINTFSGSNFLLIKSTNHTQNKSKITTTPKASQSSSKNIELRVCTSKTCRKQGSLDILQTLSGIAPPHVAVNSCGCLERCGSGPNIVILPDKVFVGHCGTPSKAANVMSIVCGEDESGGEKCLEALALRKRAEDEISGDDGDFSMALSLLSQALDLKPFGGVHIIYKDRSAARLAMGDINGALEDAKEAIAIARYYPEAYICEGDVLMAMENFDAAQESYSIALELDPSIRRSKSFKARIAKLQEKLAPTEISVLESVSKIYQDSAEILMLVNRKGIVLSS